MPSEAPWAEWDARKAETAAKARHERKALIRAQSTAAEERAQAEADGVASDDGAGVNEVLESLGVPAGAGR